MYTATLSRIRTLCRLLLRITSRKDNPAQTSSRHPCSEGFSLSEVPLNSMQTLLSRLQLISPSVQMSFGGESSANPSPKAILDSCSDMDRKFRASTKVTDRLHEYSFIYGWRSSGVRRLPNRPSKNCPRRPNFRILPLRQGQRRIGEFSVDIRNSDVIVGRSQSITKISISNVSGTCIKRRSSDVSFLRPATFESKSRTKITDHDGW